MIAYLKGSFIDITPSSVIVDVQGIGYEVHISLHTYSQIQGQSSGLLYTHLLIKEDAHLLYGFADIEEKNIFKLLLSVSGIGANTARLILSYMKPFEITQAIANGDSRALERIKGIGKKTAERTVLELKDKIGKQPTENIIPAETTSASNTRNMRQDALDALQALGINRQAAEQHIIRICQAEPDIQLEELIKKVLKGL
ncbi:Holliday junction branch migration protein RuvA [Niabella digestorum]|uniref:Holliday junction branch migration complex subunit RuvA n=1 Tax=Niabella digestorum TaxID=3117701 RepID=A0ABU7RE32_9BACT